MDKKAFTLLELMIVVSIIGILTVVAIVALNKSRTRKEVETEARTVAAAIREAQNYALTGKAAQAGDLPCRYRFLSDSSSGSYEIRYSYHTDTGGNCATSIISEKVYATYSLKNNVSFGADSDFYFTVPHGILSSAGALTLTMQKSANTYNICVYPSGLVQERGAGGC